MDNREVTLDAIARLAKAQRTVEEALRDRDDGIRKMHTQDHMTAPQIARALDGQVEGVAVSISNVRLVLRSVPR